VRDNSNADPPFSGCADSRGTWLRKNHAPIDSAAQLVLAGAVAFTAWTFFDNYTLKQERLVLITDHAKSVPEIDDEWGQLTSVSESEAAQCPTQPPPCDPATEKCTLPRQYKAHENLFYNRTAWTEILNLPYFLKGCIKNHHCDESMTLDFFCPSMIKLDVLLTAHHNTYFIINDHVVKSKGLPDQFKGLPSDKFKGLPLEGYLLQMEAAETPRNLADILEDCKSRTQYNDYKKTYYRYHDDMLRFRKECEPRAP